MSDLNDQTYKTSLKELMVIAKIPLKDYRGEPTKIKIHLNHPAKLYWPVDEDEKMEESCKMCKKCIGALHDIVKKLDDTDPSKDIR